jgi:carboxylate-amine ligase
MDEALINFDVRRSVRFPTVELLIADVCTDIEDSVALACLARGLVSSLARQWRQGAPTPLWAVDRLRAARKLAARHGLSRTLVHPLTGRHEEAPKALEAAIRVAAPALESSGDADRVRSAAARWVSEGTGAARQRAVGARGLPAVVDDLVTRTCRTANDSRG